MTYSSSLFAPHVVQPIKLVTPAAGYPVTLDEVKLHLKIDGTLEDTLLTSLISTVTEFYENFTKRDFITKTYRLFDHHFRTYYEIRKCPNVTITSIKYFDLNNTEQTVASDVYELTETPDFPVLYKQPKQIWPSVYNKPQAVNITFTCGYGTAADVPDVLKQAILIGIAALYENRGDCGDSGNGCGDCSVLLNPLAKSLLKSYRINDLAVNYTNVRF